MIEHLPCVSFTSLSVRTRFNSSAAAGSHVVTTQRRFTAHAQLGHVVIMCTLTLHFLWILSSDNRGWTVMLKQENIYEHDRIPVYIRPLNRFGSHAGA